MRIWPWRRRRRSRRHRSRRSEWAPLAPAIGEAATVADAAASGTASASAGSRGGRTRWASWKRRWKRIPRLARWSLLCFAGYVATFVVTVTLVHLGFVFLKWLLVGLAVLAWACLLAGTAAGFLSLHESRTRVVAGIIGFALNGTTVLMLGAWTLIQRL